MWWSRACIIGVGRALASLIHFGLLGGQTHVILMGWVVIYGDGKSKGVVIGGLYYWGGKSTCIPTFILGHQVGKPCNCLGVGSNQLGWDYFHLSIHCRLWGGETLSNSWGGQILFLRLWGA